MYVTKVAQSLQGVDRCPQRTSPESGAEDYKFEK